MSQDDINLTVPVAGVEMADRPARVFPDVMTEQEVVVYLRLDLINIKDPSATLAYYRRKGLLRATQLGKCVRYRKIEVERFLATITEQNPR